MRKTAYILGTICAVLSLAGAILKLSSLPGGAILLILFTSLFSIGALPLYLYSLGKVETEKAMQFAVRLCGFSFAVLQVGLLFYAQRWPEPMRFIYAGLAGQIVFLILFTLNVRKPEVKTKGFSLFAVLPLLILLSLVLGCYDRTKDSEIERTQYEQYENVRIEATATMEHSIELLANLGKDDSLWNNDSAAIAFLNSGLDMVKYIESMKREFILLSNYGDENYPDTTGEIHRPLDKETAAAYMIGPDVTNPTGQGVVLYNKLYKFRKEVLPAAVGFSVPVSDDNQQQEQWVKDNFYNATILEALLRLTMIQKAVCTAINTAIETNAYIEKQ